MPDTPHHIPLVLEPPAPAAAAHAAAFVDGLVAELAEARARAARLEAALQASEARHRQVAHVTQALQEARARAESASRAKDDFLARMSHELRTPLNSVIGFADVLRKNTARRLGAQELLFAGRIADNGRHLLAIINAILQLAQVESGAARVERTPCALGTLVDDTLAELEPLAARRGLVLRAERPAFLAALATDASRLREVLRHLVGNALTYTAAGEVVVRVVADAASGVPVLLEVEDTGPGIADERRERIFEPFEQGDGTTARRHDGTGLGLAISRALCAQMGYALSVESRVGAGSTFRVAFGG